jgi:hypothetical protein
VKLPHEIGTKHFVTLARKRRVGAIGILASKYNFENIQVLVEGTPTFHARS